MWAAAVNPQRAVCVVVWREPGDFGEAMQRHQLAEAEGFNQVVIRPHFKTQHPIGFTVPGTDHQDRRVVVEPAQFPAEVQSPQPRKHQIEHEQIHMLGRLVGEQA